MEVFPATVCNYIEALITGEKITAVIIQFIKIAHIKNNLIKSSHDRNNN